MAMCRECPTRILWVRTRKGRAMAVNAYPGEHTPNIAVQRVGDRLVDARVITADQPAQVHEETYVAHWVTCPKADEMRRTRTTSNTNRSTVTPAEPALF